LDDEFKVHFCLAGVESVEAVGVDSPVHACGECDVEVEEQLNVGDDLAAPHARDSLEHEFRTPLDDITAHADAGCNACELPGTASDRVPPIHDSSGESACNACILPLSQRGSESTAHAAFDACALSNRSVHVSMKNSAADKKNSPALDWFESRMRSSMTGMNDCTDKGEEGNRTESHEFPDLITNPLACKTAGKKGDAAAGSAFASFVGGVEKSERPQGSVKGGCGTPTAEIPSLVGLNLDAGSSGSPSGPPVRKSIEVRISVFQSVVNGCGS
jgi:hypothetical protein